MATHTNSLTSHHGEHRTHDAQKMCPPQMLRIGTRADQERLDLRQPSSYQRGIIKRYHARKSRRFHTKNCRVYKTDPAAIE